MGRAYIVRVPPCKWKDPGYRRHCCWEMQPLLYLILRGASGPARSASRMLLILTFCVSSLWFPVRHAIRDVSGGGFQYFCLSFLGDKSVYMFSGS